MEQEGVFIYIRLSSNKYAQTVTTIIFDKDAALTSEW